MKIQAIQKNASFCEQQKIDISNKKIYLLTNSDNFSSDTTFFNAIEDSIHGGVDIIQFREKNMPEDRMMELGRKLKQLCEKYKIPFIINDKIKIAEMLKADGVHLGQGDDGAVFARKMLGNNAIVGISTQKPEQALKALNDGADYIGVGPVFKTPLKNEPLVGMDYLRWASKNIPIPIFAIGGINMSNIDEVINAGIKKIAFIRTIINAESPRKAAETYLKKLS